MMGKKAFTLIEVLAIIVVLGVLVTIVTPSTFNIIKTSKQKAYNALIETFRTSANLYVSKNRDEIKKDIDSNNVAIFTLQDLADNKLIKKTLVDPRTNNSVPLTKRFYAYYDGIGAILVCYEDDNCTIPDDQAPIITLLGNSVVNMYLGGVYEDAGVTAYDNIDGDITDNVVSTGTANVNLAGTYTITYNVSDAKGNAALPVSRTVIVSDTYIVTEGVNKPVLATGMTAVKWNSSTSAWDNVANPNTDTSWYDYPNKQWANAKTADGSFWVWIPRYIYKISSCWHTACSSGGTIDVQFSMATDDTRGGTVTLDTGITAAASNNKWTNHPAFNFDGTQLLGFWVAKFEASNDGSNNVKIIPTVTPWRSTTFVTMYNVSRAMETTSIYGWGTSGTGLDTHMMKNIEWGSVAYLSRSTYGQSTSEVWNNPADTMITGCAGDSASSSATTGCLRAYSTTNGVKASTTGTIQGVYDMNGGAAERTSANYGNNTASGGIDPATIPNKYIDRYSGDNYGYNVNNKGDATYETAQGAFVFDGTIWSCSGGQSWFGDSAYFPRAAEPWFIRGGSRYDTTSSGPYEFNYSNGGSSYTYQTFRPVIIVSAGL